MEMQGLEPIPRQEAGGGDENQKQKMAKPTHTQSSQTSADGNPPFMIVCRGKYHSLPGCPWTCGSRVFGQRGVAERAEITRLQNQVARQSLRAENPHGVNPSNSGIFAWGAFETSAPLDCRTMEKTPTVSELQSQHELKAPRRADPGGAGIQLAGDDPELAGPIRDIGIRIAVDRMVEQVKRLGSELQFQPFGKGYSFSSAVSIS